VKTAVNPYRMAGFGVSATAAVFSNWSLPEFCWSTWLAGLVYSWTCVITAAVQIMLAARMDKETYGRWLPLLRRFSPGVLLLGVRVISVAVGLIGFRLYSFLFGFYGLFLSIFSEMEPLTLFGRNGFINSDFFTPVFYLTDRFWPMALGVLLANWGDFVQNKPWRRVLLPFQKEIIRIHIMILVSPFFSLIAWALFGKGYQSITIVLLMSLFYLLPKKAKKGEPEHAGNPDYGAE